MVAGLGRDTQTHLPLVVGADDVAESRPGWFPSSNTPCPTDEGYLSLRYQLSRSYSQREVLWGPAGVEDRALLSFHGQMRSHCRPRQKGSCDGAGAGDSSTQNAKTDFCPSASAEPLLDAGYPERFSSFLTVNPNKKSIFVVSSASSNSPSTLNEGERPDRPGSPIAGPASACGSGWSGAQAHHGTPLSRWTTCRPVFVPSPPHRLLERAAHHVLEARSRRTVYK